jgi:mono/diheme cytochrome c family protein
MVREVIGGGSGRWLVPALAVGLAACGRPGGPDRYPGSEFTSSTAGTTGGGGTGGAGGAGGTTIAHCAPAQSSEGLPARTTLESGTSSSGPPTYFTSDLFEQFKHACGGCHVESNLGNFLVTEASFPMVVDMNVYNIITSDDPNVYMPPAGGGGMPFTSRPDSDPIKQLANLLSIWLMQGSPPDLFYLPDDGSSAAVGYALTTTLGSQMTNIGSCIPDKQMVAMDTTDMDQLDAMFAQATALPPTLDKTDLSTLDSEELAKTGVVSYAPTYPLYTDGAGKMRYVRVPRGKSIQFDKTKQQFQIPANTRFYKTFLKDVIDANGNPSWRKMETRVIVSRPDTNNPDGTAAQQNALYGTYVWNADESQATLLNDPLRNGQPFSDRMLTYITDEVKAQAIIDSMPNNLEGALYQAGLSRHYALPGSERCVQCHMGSPSQSFILGFTPLQVARRAAGTGGVYEEATGDELTQLQRLIDYGVITGVSSPDDVAPLEKSEGTRLPRNDYELAAQAYMVGNCAHCHNARGLPSIKQPALKDVLVFLPGTGPHDGIFQFNIDTMSPIRKRGQNHDVLIPYITPSLYDLPSLAASAKDICPDFDSGVCAAMCTPIGCANMPPQSFILAPWRSLIYRNTDTAYDYFDDYTPFPHMPLNSPGYDCRVTKILGDWMVSIPAVLKDPTKVEDVTTYDDAKGVTMFPSNSNFDPQPYKEIKPTDTNYSQAMATTQNRMSIYHNGYRYGFCPDTYKRDIVDPVIEAQIARNIPVTSDLGPVPDPNNPMRTIMPALTPLRPHWVNFDDTEPPGDWFPRRPDWPSALVHPDIPGFVAATVMSEHIPVDAAADLGNVLTALQNVTLTSDVRAALTTEVPFGLWDTTTTPGCNFSGIPTAGSFQGASRPYWMDLSMAPASAPVYMESYGAAVFTTICFNCHGENADSKGLLADEISIMTGGDARVADFRDGLFGPVATPGTNRAAVFGPGAAMIGGGVTADDVTARYMAWMALGGTSKHLPQDVLNEVSDSPVLGVLRPLNSLGGTPDMLRLGLDLCSQIALSTRAFPQITLSDFIGSGRYSWRTFSGLVESNGDADMWLHLCNLGNRPVVRVAIGPDSGGWTATSNAATMTISGSQLYWAVGPNGEDWYGQNPVMDHLGSIATGVQPSNLVPLCVQPPSSAAQKTYADAALAIAKVNGNVIPYCPANFAVPCTPNASGQPACHQLQVSDMGDFTDGRKWAARGAINAALAVFLYLDGIEKDPTKRKPLFNECSQLGKQ